MNSTDRPDGGPAPFTLGVLADPAPTPARLPRRTVQAPTAEETAAFVRLLENLGAPTAASLRARPGPRGRPFRLPG